MPIDVNGQEIMKFEELPSGSTLLPRSASALTALELSECIAKHIAQTVEGKLGLPAGELYEKVLETLRLDGRLNKEHLTYPRVSWYGDVAQCEDEKIRWRVTIWMDTVRNFPVSSGDGWEGIETQQSLAQERTSKPDEIRRRFDLIVKTKAKLPSGQTVSVALPSDTALSAGGLPTAAALRARQAEEQARGFEMISSKQPPPMPPVDPPVQLASSELLAEPPKAEDLVVDAPPAGSPGGIAKKAPPAALGRSKGRK